MVQLPASVVHQQLAEGASFITLSNLLQIDSPEPLFRELVRENSTEYELKLSFYAKLWALSTTGKSLDDGALWKEVEQVARLEQDIAEILRPTAETVTNVLRTNHKFKISQLNEQLPLVGFRFEISKAGV